MNVPIRINDNETLTISMNTKLYQLLREYEESNIRNCYKHIDENFDEKFLEDFSKISEPLKME